MDPCVNVTDSQGDTQLPIVHGTMGTPAVDIHQMYGQHNLLAYDPGFRSTASCSSAITYIDGEAGVLLYRGYPIEELAEHSSFIEVAHLLMFGELPTPQERDSFWDNISHHTLLHEQILKFYQGFQ